MPLELSREEEAMASGHHGEAVRFAMRILTKMAEIEGATRLILVTSAHVDGCLYHGQAGIDFAERLVEGGAHVAIPTTLNVSSLDLLHPELVRTDPETTRQARHLMDLYTTMGCRPTWTCAPYQLPDRPRLGEHVAWAESNAIVFANSVLGARTDRYGDFIDICAAITGRVPDAGLHRTEQRRGQIVFRTGAIDERLKSQDVFYAVLGHLVGTESGSLVPVIEGLPNTVNEDQLKAFGAAAASSGAVAMFHAAGITPEAPTLEEALQGGQPVRVVDVDLPALTHARNSLSTSAGEPLAAVSVGTPHLSIQEFARLVALLDGVRTHPDVDFFVSTARHTLEEVDRRGWSDACRRAGVQIVTDTCTYITPVIRPRGGAVMTNSAKWSYYAPGNLGVPVVFASLEECVRSAVEGRVWRDPSVWAPA